MKKITIILLTLITLSSYSQPIDYSNFDDKLADKALAEAFLHFRDTIFQFSDGRLWLDYYPALKTHPDLALPVWSDKIYELISKPNCYEMTRLDLKYNNKHPDREEWWFKKGIQQIFAIETYKNVKSPQMRELLTNTHGRYCENIMFSPNHRSTYQELATAFIICWDNSPTHSSLMRATYYDVYSFDNYNIKVRGIFACSISYNSYSKSTYAALNFIH